MKETFDVAILGPGLPEFRPPAFWPSGGQLPQMRYGRKRKGGTKIGIDSAILDEDDFGWVLLHPSFLSR